MLPELSINKPENLAKALAALAEEDLKIIAGGTDLIPQLRRNPGRSLSLLDISDLAELNYIRPEGPVVKIGALTTFTGILESDLLKTKVPLLQMAAQKTGGVQTRNRGTIGGNICNAYFKADCLCALSCLNAKVKLLSVNSSRLLDISDFIRAPGDKGLKRNELIKEVIIESLDSSYRSAFYKLGSRNAMTRAVVNAAVTFQMQERKIKNISFVMGGFTPSLIRLDSLYSLLSGVDASEALFREVSDKIFDMPELRGSGIDTDSYAGSMARVAVERVLLQAAGLGRAEGEIA